MRKSSSGYLKMYIGPMFSGKSDKLISECLNSHTYGGLNTLVFKPVVDTRFSDTAIVSRSGLTQTARNLPTELTDSLVSELISECLNISPDIIYIDEIQFFDAGIVSFVRQLITLGIDVVCSGLSLSRYGTPFGETTTLCAYADEVTVLSSYCHQCKSPARYTVLVDGNDLANQTNNDLLLESDKVHFLVYCPKCYDEYMSQ